MRVGRGAAERDELAGTPGCAVKDAHGCAIGIAELQPGEIAAVRQADHPCVEALHRRTFAPGHEAEQASPPVTMDRFASFDGLEIAFTVMGTGPDTLLMHGFAADAAGNWIAPGVAGAMVAAGRRVILYDARGHGASGKPHDAAAYENQAMVHDASALLDHLGITAVDVVGYSMGAIVATRFVPTEPRVRSLVLGGIGGRLVSGRPLDRAADRGGAVGVAGHEDQRPGRPVPFGGSPSAVATTWTRSRSDPARATPRVAGPAGADPRADARRRRCERRPRRTTGRACGAHPERGGAHRSR